jgi:hypothetical protein
LRQPTGHRQCIKRGHPGGNRTNGSYLNGSGNIRYGGTGCDRNLDSGDDEHGIRGGNGYGANHERGDD